MEKPVVKIELAPGAHVEKKISVYGATAWHFDIVYVCADGTRYPETERHRLKRDAVAKIAKFPITPNEGEYAVCLDEKGNHTSTVWAPFARLRMVS